MTDQNYYTDYADGIRDCAKGDDHVAGKSERYNQGYADQYDLEQVISHG